jgi:hypothetical protein
MLTDRQTDRHNRFILTVNVKQSTGLDRPEGLRRLRLPDFMTIGTKMVRYSDSRPSSASSHYERFTQANTK